MGRKILLSSGIARGQRERRRHRRRQEQAAAVNPKVT
jgi:hypothetical protein